MSSIDHYMYKVLGHIECPSDYDLIFDNPIRTLPIYQLEQDIPADEKDFDGKNGDILLGGGAGEAPHCAFHILKQCAFLRLMIGIILKDMMSYSSPSGHRRSHIKLESDFGR